MTVFKVDVAGLGAWETQAKAKSAKVIRTALSAFATDVLERAPIKTGFMVSSSQAVAGPAPSVISVNRPRGYNAPEDAIDKLDEVVTTINTVTLKSGFSWAWPAKYTKYVDQGTSTQAQQLFLTGPVLKWPYYLRAAKKSK